MRVLVCGYGSIGKRHVENLMAFRPIPVSTIIVVDPDPRRLSQAALLDGVQTFPSINQVNLSGIGAAIIATPPAHHVSCALPVVQAGIPCLIEKPLAHTLEAAKTLQPYAHWIRVGYSMRFYPAIQLIREHLRKGAIGTPLHIHAEVGQYLPDWHPGEDYRQWYMAHKDQGGGAILDLSHELDYLKWFANERIHFARGMALKAHPGLDITSDDWAHFWGQCGGGPMFSCSMDLLDRRYNRRVRIIGTEDTISWDWNTRWVMVGTESLHYDNDRNIQFHREMDNFLQWVQCQQDSEALCSYADALHTLDVALAIRYHGR